MHLAYVVSNDHAALNVNGRGGRCNPLAASLCIRRPFDHHRAAVDKSLPEWRPLSQKGFDQCSHGVWRQPALRGLPAAELLAEHGVPQSGLCGEKCAPPSQLFTLTPPRYSPTASGTIGIKLP